MNIRKLSIYAVALCLSAAAAACLSGSGRPRRSERDPSSVLADLNAYFSASRLQRYRYECYADRASDDGNRPAAGLFRALARSERAHEEACSHAAELFGGKCERPQTAAFDIAATAENLRRSIDDERRRLEPGRGTAVARAISAGNYYTARVFIWIDATHRRHIEMLERCLYMGGADSLPRICSKYGVCPVCGNIYEYDNCDAYCPLCRTGCASFEMFGTLQLD